MFKAIASVSWSRFSLVIGCVAIFLSAALHEYRSSAINWDTEAVDETAADLVAKAMTESAAGGISRDTYLQILLERHRQSLKVGDKQLDPYPAWLASELLRLSGSGRLFVRRGEIISLHASSQIGDDTYWYIARLRTIDPSSEPKLVGGPWVLWPTLGRLVEPNAQRSSTQIDTYDVPNVAPGSIVILELYQLDRSIAQFYDEIKLNDSRTFEECNMILRLQVPVVLNDGVVPDRTP